ncbi:WGR domain-containing protein (plasmid) [Polymorphobacter sp. PAMC 29334]|uniref:WGR domain-containing protein n=1 Tax=Polymorphobacter sp. PAMC 29334 TaxID=2862331 RepID=UPI001C67B868|nr:WGR domain-containing protein [Polymorphobacter sp. PAMC 29334]QYE37203.1 WGR domain-containing protein [Polymorphobacter sp. PAMC 29334]
MVKFQPHPAGLSVIAAPPLPAPYALNLGRIELVAVDHSRNVNRRYSVEASEDLFGALIVETAWGRIGGWTAGKRVSFTDRAGADRVVAGHLRRRATAARRIGVAYTPVLL